MHKCLLSPWPATSTDLGKYPRCSCVHLSTKSNLASDVVLFLQCLGLEVSLFITVTDVDVRMVRPGKVALLHSRTDTLASGARFVSQFAQEL